MWRASSTRTLSVLTLAVALVLGAEPVAQSEAESQTQAQERKRQAEVVPQASIPREEKERENPFRETVKSIEAGRNLFSSQCTMCHGARGDGTGDLAKRIGWKMPDFTRPDPKAKRTDGEIFYIISKGHGQMPGNEGRLQAESLWNLVNLVRSLSR